MTSSETAGKAMTQEQQAEFYDASRSFKEFRASGRLVGRELDNLAALREKALHDPDWAELFVVKIGNPSQETASNAG
jgi:hypothetical protein